MTGETIMKAKQRITAMDYERAWNQVVQKLPGWKQKIVINNWPYENRLDARIADAAAQEAARLAEENSMARNADQAKGKDGN